MNSGVLMENISAVIISPDIFLERDGDGASKTTVSVWRVKEMQSLFSCPFKAWANY